VAAEFEDKSIASFKIKIDGCEIKTEMEIGSIKVENALYEPDRAVFTIVNAVNIPENDVYWFGEELKLGQKIEIGLGYQDKTETVFMGIITSQKAIIDQNNGSGLEIIAHDRSFAMRREKKSRIWNDVKHNDMAASLASTYNLGAKIEDTGTTHNVVEQFEENDFDLLSRLAKENGFEFYVQNGTLSFKKPDYSREPVGQVTLGESMISFTGELDIADHSPEVADSIAGANPARWSNCVTKASGECYGHPGVLPGRNIEINGVGNPLSKSHYYIERTIHNMAAGYYITTYHARQMRKQA